MNLLMDTSVLVKWFDTESEDEVPEAEALRTSHSLGTITLLILDLAVYELANVLLRRRGWPARAVADSVEDLLVLLPPLVRISEQWTTDAWQLAERHQLSAYDAAWAAAARHLQVGLVSADRELLAAGLAESATEATARLRLM